MKKILALFITCIALVFCTGSFLTEAQTKDISKESFMVNMSDFFPSFGATDKIKNSSGEGINNISSLIISLIPMVTIMMGVGATLMVVW